MRNFVFPASKKREFPLLPLASRQTRKHPPRLFQTVPSGVHSPLSYFLLILSGSLQLQPKVLHLFYTGISGKIQGQSMESILVIREIHSGKSFTYNEYYLRNIYTNKNLLLNKLTWTKQVV
jgi:hypothetical protein